MEEKLEDKITRLEEENKYPKSLLKLYGIKYKKESDTLYMKADIDNFKYYCSNFWVRGDVYVKRAVNKNTGKANYYPQCANL